MVNSASHASFMLRFGIAFASGDLNDDQSRMLWFGFCAVRSHADRSCFDWVDPSSLSASYTPSRRPCQRQLQQPRERQNRNRRRGRDGSSRCVISIIPPCQPTKCTCFSCSSWVAVLRHPETQKPSWGQAWRFRLQPFGRLSSRTKIVQITLKGSVSG